MAKAKNKVIAGDYDGKKVECSAGQPFISLGLIKSIFLNKELVDGYELVTDEHRKSAKSGIARGLVGGALLGPVGMIAGGVTAKSKGIYHIAIQFKDGKKSLIEVDDKIYNALVKKLF